MNNKLLSIIAVLIGLVLPIKMQAQVAADELYAPEFNFEGDNLVMTCETQGAIIYYSMSEFTDDDEAYDLADNMEVNEYTGTAYTEPIPITKNVVIKAIAKMPQMQGGSDYKVLIYNYTSWKQLLEAIDYGTNVLDRAQNNPNVSDDLKQDLQWAIEEGHHFYQERGMMYDSYEAVMIRQHILEIAQQIEDIIGQQTNPEPYAVLSQNNTVLTFYYDNQRDGRQGTVYDLKQWEGGYYQPWFAEPSTIRTVVFDDSFADARPTTTESWFFYCHNLEEIQGFNNLNTSSVTNMSRMFRACSRLHSLDVSHFDTRNVTDMGGMFLDCSALASLDVSHFDTGNVTDMGSMFSSCSNLSSLDVSNFNTSKVTSMRYMFDHCTELTSLDVSNFNTGNVTDMGGMFYGCRGLTNLDVSGFNTSNVTAMHQVFSECSGLTSLNVSNFNTDKVTSMWSMFEKCSSLTSLDVSNFNTANVTEMGSMFFGCSSLTSLDVSGFNTSNVTTMGWMFSGCSGLTSLDVSGFNTEKVTDMSGLFERCSGLTSIDISKLKTDNVTDMDEMFEYCSGLTSLDVNALNTSNVTSMEYMFGNCTGLTTLDLTAFNTSKVKNMSNMFRGSTRLTSINLSKFNTSNVTVMEYMFNNCSSITTIDLSSFNTAKVEDMDGMFKGCSALTTIYVGNDWTTSEETNSYEMFEGCTNLVGGAGTRYSQDHINIAYAHIDGGTANPGYLTDKNAPAPTDSEPYAVLSNNNTVLTFYYDDQKEARNGMSVGPFTYTYHSETNSAETDISWYNQRENITSIVFDKSFANYSGLTSTSHWFDQFYHISSISGIENLNTSNVTDMSYMFHGFGYYARDFVTLDLSSFNTSNVTNMRGMFNSCYWLENINVSNFDTSNVTEMAYMFEACNNLTNIDVSNFNTTKVTNMSGMFTYCKFTNLDVSNFDTRNVTTMSYMFFSCSNLTRIDLSNFNTEKVTDISYMFEGCSSLTSLDLSSFDTSNVEGFIYLFSNCSSLAAIQAGSANIPAEEYARIANPNLLVYVNEARLAPQGIQNVVINGRAQEIILTDVTTGNNNWHCPEPFTAEKISYTRNFRQQTQVGISRGWESITLPFNVQAITHETQGQIIPFGAQGNGKYFWLRGYSPEGLHRATAIEANKPYVISMPNNTEVYPSEYNLNGRVTFTASNTTVPATPELDSMIIVRDNIAMMPNYRWIPQNEYVYAINVGQPVERYAEGSVFTRNLRDVRPFEAYTVHAEVNGARPNNIRIAAQPKYDITGIKDIENDSMEGPWYSLDGRLMQSQPQRKGIYIQNGKKVVIK